MMKIMLLLSLLLQCISLIMCVTINTRSGHVIGSTVHFEESRVYRFLGIPFAEPPVGKLRFKKTQPIQLWTTPLPAVNFSQSCVQYYLFDYPWVDNMQGHSENCLYLNIWVPINKSSTDSLNVPKAVMIWIYGGGFSTGSSRLPVHDGQVLAAKGDVIVVTFNYRVGLLGFLSTGTEDAPGNMGLHDALTALKWINDNIEAFGGDKKNITLFGNSAGSVIVSYLIISPLSKGLFQRAITESGPPISLGGDAIESNFELGQKVASALKCASNSTTLKENPQEVVECLQTIDAEVLVKTAKAFSPKSLRDFSPIHGDDFLPTDPTTAVKAGDFQDVDILAGNAKDDGSIYLVSKFPELFGPYGEKDAKLNKTLAKDLILKMFKDIDFKHDVASYYLSNENEKDHDAIRSQTYHSYGDFHLVCPTLYFIERFGPKKGRTYYYYFYHQSRNTVFDSWMGVTHFTEVPFVFGRPMDFSSYYTKAEAQLSKSMIEMWTNFAKYGVPSATWREFTKSDPYVQQFFIMKTDDNYLKQHLENCNFYRPYFGFTKDKDF